jgi:hypothetical protein
VLSLLLLCQLRLRLLRLLRCGGLLGCGPAVAQVSHMLTSSGAQRLRHQLWRAEPAQASHMLTSFGAQRLRKCRASGHRK